MYAIVFVLMRCCKPAYPAKLDGTSGHIIIDMANDQLPLPQISFVPLTGKAASFILPIDDIVELKKVCYVDISIRSGAPNIQPYADLIAPLMVLWDLTFHISRIPLILAASLRIWRHFCSASCIKRSI